MRKEDSFYLGKVVKKYSFKGEVLIKLDTDEPHRYEKLDSLFIALGNQLIPFIIQESSFHKDILLRVKFEGISSEEEAENILKSKVYLPLDMLPKLSRNQFYYHEVIGFKVIDTHFGEVGIVKRIDDIALQPLFVVENKKKEVLIPITDDFIKSLDRIQKIIQVQTPEGLIDLYLER